MSGPGTVRPADDRAGAASRVPPVDDPDPRATTRPRAARGPTRRRLATESPRKPTRARGGPSSESDNPPPVDLRLALPAVAAWLGCLAGLLCARTAWWTDPGVPVSIGVAASALAGIGVLRVLRSRNARRVPSRRRPRAPADPPPAAGAARGMRWGVVAAAVCAAAGFGVATVRSVANAADPLVSAAAERSWALLRVRVSGIPEPETSRFSGLDARTSDPTGWRVTGTVVGATVAGMRWTSDTPVTVHGEGAAWSAVTPGAMVIADGRLSPTRSDLVWGVQIRARSPPEPGEPAPWWQSAAQQVRARLTEHARELGGDAAGLLPGLVVGDTSGITDELERDAKVSGIAHLLAVSGSHFTIVCGAVMLACRRAGPRWSAAAGAVTLGALVVLVGAQPSVLRAAVMSGVTLLALLTGRARSCLPALAACVLVLVILDPLLAISVGFALSVLATAGLVLLVPVWSAALRRRGWPRGWADLVTVPVAAQLVTTPVIVAISGTVPVLGVLANVLVAPVVAVALLLGMACAALGPWWSDAAAVAARAAAPLLDWIGWVAHRVSSWPGAVLPWPSSPLGVSAIVLGSVGTLILLRSGRLRTAAVAALAGAVVVLVPTRVAGVGWPPPGWLVVACEVGQGDAVAVSTGEPGTAVIVDAGPDPGLVDACLDRLGIVTVPLLVLTHLHADHVDGLPGVLDGRSVGRILVGPGREPGHEWDAIQWHAALRGIDVEQWPVGTRWVSGGLELTALGPENAFRGTDSDPNNDSVVLLAERDATRVLLTGDIEEPAQRALLTSGAKLDADVLKVPHHGSASTVPEFLQAVAPSVAVIGVGVGNGYGHPHPRLLRDLAASGTRAVLRTDEDGDAAVLVTDGELSVAERGPQPFPR